MYVRRHLLCMCERTLNVSAMMTVCNITHREDICTGHQNSGYTRLWLWWFDKKARLSTTTHTTGACASDKPFLYEYRIAVSGARDSEPGRYQKSVRKNFDIVLFGVSQFNVSSLIGGGDRLWKRPHSLTFRSATFTLYRVIWHTVVSINQSLRWPK